MNNAAIENYVDTFISLVAVQPYLKSTQLYQCASEPTGPLDPSSTNPATSTSYADYFYNRDFEDASTNPRSQA